MMRTEAAPAAHGVCGEGSVLRTETVKDTGVVLSHGCHRELPNPSFRLFFLLDQDSPYGAGVLKRAMWKVVFALSNFHADSNV